MIVFLLILSVNLDSLGVGISYGLRNIQIPLSSGIIISLFSVLYSSAALFVGSQLTHILPGWIGKTLGAAILLVMGAYIILESFRPQKPRTKRTPCSTVFSCAIRPLGITISIARDPVTCDFDRSNRIDMREALYLGLALSLDSIGVGIGAALGGINTWYIPLLIGLGQLMFLIAGTALGKRLTKFTRIDKRIWTILSGILLILLSFLHMI